MASTAPSDNTPISLSLTSQLIQDYLYTGEPPAPALGDTGGLAAIADGLFAIDGAQLMHFELDPTSQSGWRTSTIAVPQPPTAANANILAIKAFELQGNIKTLNLLCFFAAAGWEQGGGSEMGYAVSWLVRDESGGSWAPARIDPAAASLLSQLRNLEVFNAGAGKGIFVYGMTTSILGGDNAQLFTLKIGNYNSIATQSWSIASQVYLPDIADHGTKPFKVRFLASGSADRARSVSLCLWVDDDFIWTAPIEVDEENGPILEFGKVLPVGIGKAQNPLRSLVGVDGEDNWVVIAVDAAGLVHRFMLKGDGAYNHAVLNAGGAPAPSDVEAVSITRYNGRIALFAMTQQQLWLMRDVFSPAWVKLGNGVVAMATPSYEVQALELFYADNRDNQKNRIFHFSQDGPASVWKLQKLGVLKQEQVNGQSQAPTETSTVAIDVTVTHRSRRPAAQVPLTIQSDQWTVLIVDKVSYWVGPGRDASIAADDFGKASIRYEANDLQFPRLTITAGSGSNLAQGGCHGDVVDNQQPYPTTAASRLAGNDAGFTMDTAQLQSKGLIPPKQQDPDKVTSAVQSVGKWMWNKNQSAASTSTVPSVTYRIGSGGRAPAVASVGRADIAGVPALGDIKALGGILGDVGDVLNYVRHTAEDIGDMALTISDDAIQVAVAGFNCVVRTVREAGDLVATIFVMIRDKVESAIESIEDFIKKIVEFLEMLFEWKDIVRTHDVLRHMLNWSMDYVAGNVSNLKGFANGGIGKLKAGLDATIATLELQLQGNPNLTANGFANALPQKGTAGGPSQGNVLAAGPYKDHLKQHAPRCHYVFNRTKSHADRLPARRNDPVAPGVADAMKSRWATGANKEKAKSFSANFIGPSGVPGPLDINALLDTTALALLPVFKDLAVASLDGAETVIGAVLDAVKDSIGTFKGVFDKPIDIPVVSWVYSAVVEDTLFPSRNDLTLLDLICLLIAVPATVLYKAVRGSAPFSGDQVNLIKSAFNGSTIDFNALSTFGGSVTPGTLSAASFNLAAFTEVMGIVSGCLALFGGQFSIWSDDIALLSAVQGSPLTDEVPLLGLVSWASWFLSTLSTVCSAPFTTLAGLGDSPTPADIIQTIYFGLECLPAAYDLIALVATMADTLKMIPDYGPLAEGLCGFLILCAAVSYVVAAILEHEGDAWDYTNVLISSIARPFRATMPLAESDNPVIVAAVFVVILTGDYLGMFGGSATQIGSAING